MLETIRSLSCGLVGFIGVGSLFNECTKGALVGYNKGIERGALRLLAPLVGPFAPEGCRRGCSRVLWGVLAKNAILWTPLLTPFAEMDTFGPNGPGFLL
jgi:hypothetical protein